MRNIALAFAAAALMLLAGAFAFTADATTGTGTLGLPAAAKHYSPIDQVACRFAGPTCPAGYTRVCRLVKCWCARCR
jgi:hypothetical protein